jgi:transcriptional regulator with XRE-family HTH domain
MSVFLHSIFFLGLPQTRSPVYLAVMPLTGLGKRLRRARDATGASTADVGLLLGLSPRSIRRWEADECEPSVEQIARLALHYEVSVDSLVYPQSRAAAA